MLNRQATYKKKKKKFWLKSILAALSLSLIIGGTINISFANEDLKVMLTEWFDEKRNDAIVNIKTAVYSEKDIQKKRLQEEMEKEIATAEAELNKITEAEKALRIQNLREYTNKLISEINIDNSVEKEQMKKQLDSIYAEAVKALNSADASWKSSVKPGKPQEPSEPEKPADKAKPVKPEAEEPADSPEVPADSAAEDPAVPTDPSPSDEDGGTDEEDEGDGQ